MAKSTKKSKTKSKAKKSLARPINFPEPSGKKSSKSKSSVTIIEPESIKLGSCSKSSVTGNSTSLPLSEFNFQNYIKSSTLNFKIAIFTYDRQCSEFINEVEDDLAAAISSFSKNVSRFNPTVAHLTFKNNFENILSDCYFLFDTKTINILEKLIQIKSGVFAVCKSNCGYKLLNYHEESSLGFFDSNVFLKKAETAGLKEFRKIDGFEDSEVIKVGKKSASSSSSKKSKKLKKVSKAQKTTNLINYQNFQYKLTKIRDEMKKLKIKSGIDYKRAYTVKILFSSLRNGGAKILEANGKETLRKCLTDIGCVNFNVVKTFWPDQTYDVDREISQFSFLNYQVLYVEGAIGK